MTMRDCCSNQEETFGEAISLLVQTLSPTSIFLLILLILCLFLYNQNLNLQKTDNSKND